MILKHLPLDKIEIVENVRMETDDEIGELMTSIERFDVIQPVLVVPRNGKYELVSGHRRYAAMKARNESTIPAYIRDDLSELDIQLVKLTENIHRKQMSPRELVKCFEAMKKADHRIQTHAQIGKALGKSEAWVSSKYVADREFEKLLTAGVDPDLIEQLSERDFMKLSRVKNPNEKAKIAKLRAQKKGKVEEAESYSISKRKQYRYRVLGRRKLEVLCGSDVLMGRLLDWMNGSSE